MNQTELKDKAIALLKRLIATPSISKEEDKTAVLLKDFLISEGVSEVNLIKNNVWAKNKHFDTSKRTILLNSHHDTVKPASGYINDPFEPIIKDGKLFGLGSNDAGGALVSLIATFLYFYNKEVDFNLILLCSSEEEISGKEGIALAIEHIPSPDVAIVGEPTSLDMAIAEKGLMVLECTAKGKSGHAARDEGENALYKALDDINWLRNYRFAKESELFGPIKMTTTVISSGTQHNVVPDTCFFTVDIRTTDAYTNKETFEIIDANLKSEINPKSLRLNPSKIAPNHPLVESGLDLGMTTYGSPTLSDQSLIEVPSLKLGPGDSARSHTADEFIYLKQIEDGISTYIKLLKNLNYS